MLLHTGLVPGTSPLLCLQPLGVLLGHLSGVICKIRIAFLAEGVWECLSGMFYLQHTCNSNYIRHTGSHLQAVTRQEGKCWSGGGVDSAWWPGHVCIEQAQHHVLRAFLQTLWLERRWVLSNTLSLHVLMSKVTAGSPLIRCWNKGARMICL